MELRQPSSCSKLSWLGLSCILLFCLLLLILRRPDAFLHPQFWAEDGAFFYLNAYNYGLGSLLMPYRGSGCFYLFQQLAALPSAWMPVVLVPLYFNVITLAATLGVVA